jgi:eukaryotic-like serine/threonine-protein kinase
VLPQMAGSVVNISYNLNQIVGHLTPVQQRRFDQLVIAYNALIYPMAVVLFVRAAWPVWRCWNALSGTAALPDAEVDAARQQALRLPKWVAGLTALGWFPGGLLFPVLIHFTASPLPPAMWMHFATSFCMSGLIALAYSLCGVRLVVLRVLYPGIWQDTRGFISKTRDELASVNGQLYRMQFLAGAIPLVGAMLLGIGETVNYQLLVNGLILLGMCGFFVASAVVRELSQVVATLTSAKV